MMSAQSESFDGGSGGTLSGFSLATGGTGTQSSFDTSIQRISDGGIRRMGYLRLIKKKKFFGLGRTSEKRFFVLREPSAEKPAVLECHETEKKYRKNAEPELSVVVSGCFAVNRKDDSAKIKYGISVFTLEETVSVACNLEREQQEWLHDLLELQRSSVGAELMPENSPPLAPTFDYVWDVDIRECGAQQVKDVLGPYRLCMQERTFKLAPLGKPIGDQTITFPLVKVRKVGHTIKKNNLFYLEVGRIPCAEKGGTFCMESDEKDAVLHMHDVISEAEQQHEFVCSGQLLRHGAFCPARGMTEFANRVTLGFGSSFRWSYRSQLEIAMRKPAPPDETGRQNATGHRHRSNTSGQDSRPRNSIDNRRHTYETASNKSQSSLFSDENSSTPVKTSSQGLSGSREKAIMSENRVPEYFVPDFARSTSTGEDNYLAIDRDASYLPLNFSPKMPSSPEAGNLNYSAISTLSQSPQPHPFPSPFSAVREQRPPPSLSIPEEPGDYMPLTMPSASSHHYQAPVLEQPKSATSSGESGYFDMTFPAKNAQAPKSTPPAIVSPTTAGPEKEPVADQAGYMMMAPGSAASSSGVSDSRRSTMSNSSYQSRSSDREEHADTLGEVTYAVMEGPRARNRDSSWDNSSSSINSSFGWERMNSTGSRPDYKLEKVKAFMTLEDQEDACLRENRAYSTGCQPANKPSPLYKPEQRTGPNPEAYRIRAFSLGNHSSPLASARNRKAVTQSPSAAMVLGSLPSGVSTPPTPLDIRRELAGSSASDAPQVRTPGSDSSLHSGQSVDAKKGGESSGRADDLMEVTFRPRSGT